MEKAQTRREIDRRIKELTREERSLRSAAIRNAMLTLPEFTSARTVMLFMSLPDEADVAPFAAYAIEMGKIVALPKVDRSSRTMAAWRVNDIATGLAPGVFGILEPARPDVIAPSDIDLCFVPARGFDLFGRRLGRGAGFYDRFMAEPGFRAVRCGVGFEAQLLENIPYQSHDLPVDIIITESRVIRVK